MVDHHLYGPHFIEGSLTAASYRHFLKNKLQLHFENVPLQTRSWMWIQHDGILLHFGREVTGYLNTNKLSSWVGWSGSAAWPARPADFTLLNFFYGVVCSLRHITVASQRVKMEAVRSSKTLVSYCNITRYNNSEDLRSVIYWSFEDGWWGKQGPPKCWYPVATLHAWHHKPEDLDLNLIAVKTSTLALLKVWPLCGGTPIYKMVIPFEV
jgi:hypothetical protein